jgi:hypothetical protein
MPAESISKFEDVLKAWGGRYESETYEGALHGWTVQEVMSTTTRKLNVLSKSSLICWRRH